jgi:hypothetical protein
MNTKITDRNRSCRPAWRIPAAWVALILLDVVLIGLAVTHNESVAATQIQPVDESWVVVQVDGPVDAAEDTPRFEALDVFVDSGNHPLAAWQLELISDTPGIEIVGIEGGEHVAFQEPPYYDARAMYNNRVILASFDTGRELPTGRTRIARIHVHVTGTGLCEYRTKLDAAATINGQRIPAQISVCKTGA